MLTTHRRLHSATQSLERKITMVTNTPNTAKEYKYEDTDLVTVLHGLGRVLPTSHHLVDDYEFTGGIARNVPWSIAKWWVSGTRADGKKPHGRVYVKILPNDATEYECYREVGVTSEGMAKLVTQLAGANPKNLFGQLGGQGGRDLADALKRNLKRKKGK